MTDTKTRQQVSQALRDLSLQMVYVANILETYSPDNAEQLLGAAAMAVEWSDAILEDAP